MMESSLAVGAETEGEHQAEHTEDDCGVMQKKTTLAANSPSDLQQNFAQNDDVPEDALGRCRLECLQNTSQCESGKSLEPNKSKEMLAGNSSSSHGPDLAQDEGSKKLDLDKSLPPIKTRREGQAREHSPSDLSPPSPKRLRQGSKESQDQWNGLWNGDGKQ